MVWKRARRAPRESDAGGSRIIKEGPIKKRLEGNYCEQIH